MCGIAGFLSLTQEVAEADLAATVHRMAETLHHRGPDDGGIWVDAPAGVALGHRRLSVVDLSPAGRQPMCCSCGRYVIVFNGEIYNFRDLRRELEARSGEMAAGWRGHSDTEVFLAAICRWGVEGAITRANGMFAFALWDRQERVLSLARDRLGEKPLYYGWCGSSFLFGSELKALRAHPRFDVAIDRNALAAYLRHNYVPAPFSIYRNVYKLLPGTFLQVAPGGEREHPPTPYWSARAVAEQGVATPITGGAEEAVADLDALLRDAVGMRMVADVPLGAFLSGGVDSSVVVALMQAQSAIPVRTFTIGFREAGYNEADDASAVARHLGTAHTELYVSPGEAMEVIPLLPALYDEPFSDSSQIPTFLVSRLARQHVTVVLSGDGGDELFTGYNRYFWGKLIWDKIGRIPRGLKGAGAHGLTVLPPRAWDRAFKALQPALPSRFKQPNPGEKLHKLADLLTIKNPEQLYLQLVSHWSSPDTVALGSHEHATALTDPGRWASLLDPIEHMMYLDLVTYLPDDILVKVDRASMGVSLESRIPLLDHRVVEFAWRLPMAMKVRDGRGKWLLRQVLYRYVPPGLVDRPKMGFGVPIDAWLRGPLRAWAEDLLSEPRLREEGFFDPRPIRQKWAEHLSGAREWHYYLWDVLMFQAWLSSRETLA